MVQEGKKSFAVLIDPDKMPSDDFVHQLNRACDFVFVGGSHLSVGHMGTCLEKLRKHLDLPLVIFPGSPNQIDQNADAIFLLTLISGRNPDLLIGRHVESAHILKESGLEIIPTGYLLIDGGKMTTAAYISNTQPIPQEKTDLVVSTALAGQQLGLQAIYLDCGSGADKSASIEIINKIKKEVSLPLIVGGGVKSKEEVHRLQMAGADVVVVGNLFETNPEAIRSFIR